MNRPIRLTRPIALALLALVAMGGALPASAKALNAAGEGRRLYLKLNCYGCHGMSGLGAMGPRLKGEGELEDVTEAVMFGADEGMPSYRKYVTSTDIKNIAAYLRSLGTKSEPTFNHWWEDNPSR